MTLGFVTNMKKVYSSGNLGLVPRIADLVDDESCTEHVRHVAEPTVSNALGTYSQNTVESPAVEKLYSSSNQSIISDEILLQIKNKTFSDTVDIISHVADFVNAMKGNMADRGTDRGDAGGCGPTFSIEERPSSTLESGADAVRPSAYGVDVKSLSGINMLGLDDEPQVADEFEEGEMSEINDNVASYSLQVVRRHSHDEETGGGERGKLGSACKVCGDHATGMYFGALVCVPCKVKSNVSLFSHFH